MAMVKLECKLCGKILNRSVEEFMEHLRLEHNEEFINRVEFYFFNLVE